MIKTKSDFEKAILISEMSIDSNLLCELGNIFEYGFSDNDKLIVEIDYKKAYYFYNKASICNNTEATLRLADFLHEGLGCDKDIERSIDLYNICIDRGSSAAANNLGTIYRDLHKYEEAFNWYEISQHLMAQEYNQPVYILNLALCYLYGLGISKNIKIAIEQLSQLVDDRNNNYTCVFDIQEAAYILGTIYLSQENNIEKARYYLSIANEDNDHASAQELLNIIGRH